MAEYKGTVELIGGLTPKNNGSFPLLAAKDIQVDDKGTRLDSKLQDIEEKGGGVVTVRVDGLEGTASLYSADIYQLLQSNTAVVAVLREGIYQDYQFQLKCATNTEAVFIFTEVNENGMAYTEEIHIYKDYVEIIANESPAGKDGKDGEDGKDGVSVSHSWNGTTLTIESASGTSSADLKGEKGDKGEQGVPGTAGKAGADGKSAYQIWLDAGNSGTEEDFLNSLGGGYHPSYTNLVRLSVNTDGVQYGGCGYIQDFRLSSSNALVAYPYAAVSGYIPYNRNENRVIRIVGSTAPVNNAGMYVATYDANFNVIVVMYLGTLTEEGHGSYTTRDDGFCEAVIDTHTWTSGTVYTNFASAAYIRVSLDRCEGKDMVITYDEEIPISDNDGGESIHDFEGYHVPILYLNGTLGGISKETNVSLNYIFGEKSGTCTLKWQGASSIAYPKKNYTIKFDTAFEAVDGWGEQKKYCLKANFIDHSHARNLLCAKLWGQMVKSRLTGDATLNDLPNAGAVDGFPVIISMNGKFHGLYTFNIPKDGWMFGMSGGDVRQAILCADVNGNGVKFKALADFENDFELEYSSDDASDWVLASINRLIAAVMSSDGSNIETTIADYLDWDSAMDYMIHTVLTTGHDNVVKNYILATYDGVKWFFSAYDMDSTFGLYWDGKTILPAYYTPTFEHIAQTNKVFELIWKYKRGELRTRYNALRSSESPMSEENIARVLGNFISNIPEPLFVDDVRRWPGIPSSASSTPEQIINYYRLRVLLCDKLIKNTNGETELPEQVYPDAPPSSTYSVVNNLAGVNTSNSSIEVTEGDSYSAVLSAETIFTGATHGVGNVKVTMGGIDITSTAYNSGTITISEVTGDITVSAIGYADDCRLSSSGAYKSGAYCTATALIPCANGDTVRIGGDPSVVRWSKNTDYIVAYDSNKNVIAIMTGERYDYSGSGTFANITTTNNVTKITLSNTNVAYIAVSAASESGTDRTPNTALIVTVNEEIV